MTTLINLSRVKKNYKPQGSYYYSLQMFLDPLSGCSFLFFFLNSSGNEMCLHLASQKLETWCKLLSFSFVFLKYYLQYHNWTIKSSNFSIVDGFFMKFKGLMGVSLVDWTIDCMRFLLIDFSPSLKCFFLKWLI